MQVRKPTTRIPAVIFRQVRWPTQAWHIFADETHLRELLGDFELLFLEHKRNDSLVRQTATAMPHSILSSVQNRS